MKIEKAIEILKMFRSYDLIDSLIESSVFTFNEFDIPLEVGDFSECRREFYEAFDIAVESMECLK